MHPLSCALLALLVTVVAQAETGTDDYDGFFLPDPPRCSYGNIFTAADGSTVRPGNWNIVVQQEDPPKLRVLMQTWFPHIRISFEDLPFYGALTGARVMYAVADGRPRELLVVSSRKEAETCVEAVTNFLEQCA